MGKTKKNAAAVALGKGGRAMLGALTEFAGKGLAPCYSFLSLRLASFRLF